MEPQGLDEMTTVVVKAIELSESLNVDYLTALAIVEATDD
jgi:hypothetical protein